MKTYWDLSERDRAGLDRDAVASYADAELMLKGVLRPDAPPVMVVVEPAISTRKFYRVGPAQYDKIGLAFDTESSARAFLALNPRRVASDWRAGSKECVTPPLTLADSIFTSDLPTEEDVNAHLAALKEANAAKEANEKAASEYLKQASLVESALKGLWEDWHACRDKEARMQRVASTFEKYTTLADGDLAIAAKFLRQAFALDEIEEASMWTGVAMNIAEPLQAAS